VRDLSGVGAVVHKEKVELADVVDEESLVAGGHHVAGLLVGTVTDLGHDGLSLEATAHGIVNTLGLSPAGVYAHEAVRLVAGEARSALLDDGNMLLCGGHCVGLGELSLN